LVEPQNIRRADLLRKQGESAAMFSGLLLQLKPF